MFIKPRLRSVAVGVALAVTTCTAAMAGNPFRGMTTTESGYHTWDSDLINLEECRRPVMVFTSRCSTPAWCRTGATTFPRRAWRRTWVPASISRCRSGLRRASRAGSTSKWAICRSRPGSARRARPTARMSRARSSVTSTRSNSDPVGGLPVAADHRARDRAGRHRDSGARARRLPGSGAPEMRRPGSVCRRRAPCSGPAPWSPRASATRPI